MVSQVAAEDNDKYQTLEGREGISWGARKANAKFVKHPLASHYDAAFQAHLECFDYTVNDDEVKLGAPENRTSHQHRSKVHKLECGHHVLGDVPELCGENCHKANNINTPLYCLLCFRDAETKELKRFPTCWHELLLPKHYSPGKELDHWKQFEVVMRPGQPVYLYKDGTLVVPNHMTAVMVIAAMEKIYENKVKY
jgi:hypothetical protein